MAAHYARGVYQGLIRRLSSFTGTPEPQVGQKRSREEDETDDSTSKRVKGANGTATDASTPLATLSEDKELEEAEPEGKPENVALPSTPPPEANIDSEEKEAGAESVSTLVADEKVTASPSRKKAPASPAKSTTATVAPGSPTKSEKGDKKDRVTRNLPKRKGGKAAAKKDVEETKQTTSEAFESTVPEVKEVKETKEVKDTKKASKKEAKAAKSAAKA